MNSFICFKCIALVLVSASMQVMAETGMAVEFDSAYNAWRKYCRESIPMHIQIRGNLDHDAYFGNAEFKAIITLGVPGVSYAMEMLEEDSWLAVYISAVTKWKYNLERSGVPRHYRWMVREYPHIITTNHPPVPRVMWQWWWQEGRFLTGEKFAALYPKWRGLKAAGKSKEKEAAAARLEIRNLGIPVIEYVVTVLDESPDFIPDFIYLTDAELPAEATAAQCRAWWEKNKTKFDLPPKPANPEPITFQPPEPKW